MLRIVTSLDKIERLRRHIRDHLNIPAGGNMNLVPLIIDADQTSWTVCVIGRRRIVAWRQHLLPAGNNIRTLSSRPRDCFATPRSPRLARRCLRLGACKKTGARSFPRARNFAWGVGSERERGSTQRRSSCVLAHRHFLGPGVGVTLRPVCPAYRRVSGAQLTEFWRECRTLLV